MWKRSTTAATALAAAALAVFATATASAGEPGTVEGRILDSTCFGPCVVDMEPIPYKGEATVVVTRLPQRRRVEVLTPEPDGSFEARLAPGRYKLKVRIEDPCFVEDERVLRVSAGGDTDRPELLVHNDCIK